VKRSGLSLAEEFKLHESKRLLTDGRSPSESSESSSPFEEGYQTPDNTQSEKDTHHFHSPSPSDLPKQFLAILQLYQCECNTTNNAEKDKQVSSE
jgi:hypothetical protein